MKSIYSLATVVRVWLGAETPGSSEVMRILERMAEGKPLWEIFVLGSFTFEQQLKVVISIFETPWWRKVWILQKVVLAREVKLHCGRNWLSHRTSDSIVMNRITWFAAEWWRKQEVNSAMISQVDHTFHKLLTF
jgi:hypothetical protein